MIFGIVSLLGGLYILGYFIFGNPKEGLGSLFLFALVPIFLGIWAIRKAITRRR